jgi:hypothetical protein
MPAVLGVLGGGGAAAGGAGAAAGAGLGAAGAAGAIGGAATAMAPAIAGAAVPASAGLAAGSALAAGAAPGAMAGVAGGIPAAAGMAGVAGGGALTGSAAEATAGLGQGMWASIQQQLPDLMQNFLQKSGGAQRSGGQQNREQSVQSISIPRNDLINAGANNPIYAKDVLNDFERPPVETANRIAWNEPPSTTTPTQSWFEQHPGLEAGLKKTGQALLDIGSVFDPNIARLNSMLTDRQKFNFYKQTEEFVQDHKNYDTLIETRGRAVQEDQSKFDLKINEYNEKFGFAPMSSEEISYVTTNPDTVSAEKMKVVLGILPKLEGPTQQTFWEYAAKPVLEQGLPGINWPTQAPTFAKKPSKEKVQPMFDNKVKDINARMMNQALADKRVTQEEYTQDLGIYNSFDQSQYNNLTRQINSPYTGPKDKEIQEQYGKMTDQLKQREAIKSKYINMFSQKVPTTSQPGAQPQVVNSNQEALNAYKQQIDSIQSAKGLEGARAKIIAAKMDEGIKKEILAMIDAKLSEF